MSRRALARVVLALLLAALPTAAQAKGASAATISGGGPGGLPGGPITLSGDGEPGTNTDLSLLAEDAGVFPLLFEDGYSGALPAAPTDRLGSRYTIVWTFPNGDGGEDKVRQSVWPYAAGGPVTHMASGQPVADGTTRGGWFRATDGLRQRLIGLGLPNRPALAAPEPAAPAPAPAVWPRLAAGAALLLAVAVVAALALRRRSGPGTATAR
jgi:hypothetical protein